MKREEAKNIKLNTPFPDDPLISATKKNDLYKMKELIASGDGDVDCVEWHGRRGLEHAVRSVEALELLVQHGFKLTQRSLCNFIAYAVGSDPEAKKRREILAAFIELGAPIDGEPEIQPTVGSLRPDNDEAPITVAMRWGRHKFMATLLEKGADPNNVEPYNQNTPMHELAAHWDYWDLGKEISADANSRKACDLLLKYGATPSTCYNKDGNTALHVAALYRVSGAFSYLVGKGMCLLQPNLRGVTPLTLCKLKSASHVPKKAATPNAFEEVYHECFSAHYGVNQSTGEVFRKPAGMALG